MYKAKNQGSVIIKGGQLIRYDAGSEIDLPKGSLDHCPDLEWIAPRKNAEGPKSLEDMTVKELKSLAEEKGIEVSGRKADLIEQIKEADSDKAE